MPTKQLTDHPEGHNQGPLGLYDSEVLGPDMGAISSTCLTTRSWLLSNISAWMRQKVLQGPLGARS